MENNDLLDENVSVNKDEINIGNVALNVLNNLILKIFTLPIKIYIRALVNLSYSFNEPSKSSIDKDFPIYSWFIKVFDSIIVLVYPLGLISSIYLVTNMYDGGFKAFLNSIVVIYFLPLIYSLVKELLQITLKMLEYLKEMSLKK
jgi:hypothetical protein